MTAYYQITCAIPWLSCEQLPYLSEHPRISRMRQRDKWDLPLPVLSYKYFLLEYSSTLSFYSPKLTFPAVAPPKASKISNESLSPPNPKFSIVFFARRWPSTSLFLRSVHHPASFTFTMPLFIRNSSYWTFLSFFCCSSFYPKKTFRICPIRLSSLPINHTSNLSAH